MGCKKCDPSEPGWFDLNSDANMYVTKNLSQQFKQETIHDINIPMEVDLAKLDESRDTSSTLLIIRKPFELHCFIRLFF